MLELCLDTSANTTVALLEDGRVLARANHESTRHHAEQITPLVREALGTAGLSPVLAEAGVERVCVGTGPAPFTGLRAGLVSARVMARAAGAPVHGAASLDVIARQGLDRLPPETHVFAIADARRRELYWGHYIAEGPDDVRLVGRLEVGDVHSLVAAMRGAESPLIVAAGPLPAHSQDALEAMEIGPLTPLDPAVLSRIVSARLARGESERLGTEPQYLRRPDIHGQPSQRL